MKTKFALIVLIVLYLFLLIILAEFVRFDMRDAILKALGAFTGAFFAFLFIRIGEMLTKLYERQRTHYSALVKLEHIFYRYLNDISDNVSVIEEISKIKQRANNNPPTLSYNWLEAFIINDDILLDLANIALINEIASFNVNLRKINSDMESINGLYDEIRQAALHRLITPDSYIQNFEHYVTKLERVKAFLESLNEKSKRVLAIIRLLLKKRPAFNRLFGSLFPELRLLPSEKAIGAELDRVEEEIKEIRRKSREEINKTLDASQSQ